MESKQEILEKELKRIKRNFKNSQIHSKNCYRKLKKKFIYYKNFYENAMEEFNELYTTIDYYERTIHDLKEIVKIYAKWLWKRDKILFDNVESFIFLHCVYEVQETYNNYIKDYIK